MPALTRALIGHPHAQRRASRGAPPVPTSPGTDLDVRAIGRDHADGAVVLEDRQLHRAHVLEPVLAERRSEVVVVEVLSLESVRDPRTVACDDGGGDVEDPSYEDAPTPGDRDRPVQD